jgi:hypothetical protein
MHRIACQLTQQYIDRGQTCYNLEYWVEQGMGRAMLRTKNRIHANPELLVVGMHCDESGLQRMAVELGMSFNPLTADSTSTASGTKAGDRLSSWTRLTQRYSGGTESSNSNTVSNTGKVEGKRKQLEAGEWRAVQVGACLH